MTYHAIEFDRRSCEPTGRVLTFVGETIETAVRACLDTIRLADAACHRGPSGRTVFTTRNTYCIGIARNQRNVTVGA